ncbi:MAG: hypothetical protein ACM3X6_05305 [Patescibacteria group bacterium]
MKYARILAIRGAVFAVIFSAAGLIITRGELLRTFLMTALATAVYVGLTALMGLIRKR